ncbi:Uncharacterised protein [Mycobacteroides abscessus subsp. abscessus]|nr:Uncharacterised protein [Mycobacteroides abscessus subsp. abscessus]
MRNHCVEQGVIGCVSKAQFLVLSLPGAHCLPHRQARVRDQLFQLRRGGHIVEVLDDGDVNPRLFQPRQSLTGLRASGIVVNGRVHAFNLTRDRSFRASESGSA